MTIMIGIAQAALTAGLPEMVRSLLPFIEPIALAAASACGAGLLAQLGLQLALTLARHALATRA
ncbi:hypothetical protein ACFFNX_45040 [Actinoallomurus acaciae]|uniref:Uncharacterized protein n=2 Tax=Actinoallomurus acaciae TaxID=502577 RepID=A0ABV5YY55_9ACTN